MSTLPQRKNIRLKNFNYSQAGYYFITICTHNKQHLLWNTVGDGFHAVPLGFHSVSNEINATSQIEFNTIGKEVMKTLEYINNHYPNVKIDKFVIMPNHIHFIVILEQSVSGGHGNPPLHKVIGQLKSYTNKIYNELNQRKNLILWQRNYYEHIIKNEEEYKKIYEYIETNPLKWKEDKYFN